MSALAAEGADVDPCRVVPDGGDASAPPRPGPVRVSGGVRGRCRDPGGLRFGPAPCGFAAGAVDLAPHRAPTMAHASSGPARDLLLTRRAKT